MSYNLFLDDIRNPKDVALYIQPVNIKRYYTTYKWVTVRDYDSFVKTITKMGMPDIISFDHDHANEHYDQSMFTQELGERDYNDLYETFNEKTGLDCARWLMEYCRTNSYALPTYIVHSMNPIGKQNILTELRNYSK